MGAKYNARCRTDPPTFNTTHCWLLVTLTSSRALIMSCLFLAPPLGKRDILIGPRISCVKYDANQRGAANRFLNLAAADATNAALLADRARRKEEEARRLEEDALTTQANSCHPLVLR